MFVDTADQTHAPTGCGDEFRVAIDLVCQLVVGEFAIHVQTDEHRQFQLTRSLECLLVVLFPRDAVSTQTERETERQNTQHTSISRTSLRQRTRVLQTPQKTRLAEKNFGEVEI